jgi:hypothetical protein
VHRSSVIVVLLLSACSSHYARRETDDPCSGPGYSETRLEDGRIAIAYSGKLTDSQEHLWGLAARRAKELCSGDLATERAPDSELADRVLCVRGERLAGYPIVSLLVRCEPDA